MGCIGCIASSFEKISDIASVHDINVKKFVKKSVASAISIFNNSGIPIITQAKNENELNREIINGGFFSAVSNFAKLGLGLNDASVKFESPSTGVFIIRRSEHFIASILWHDMYQLPGYTATT
jgi:hypothetical protein